MENNNNVLEIRGLNSYICRSLILGLSKAYV